jgi:hypothetical protein
LQASYRVLEASYQTLQASYRTLHKKSGTMRTLSRIGLWFWKTARKFFSSKFQINYLTLIFMLWLHSPLRPLVKTWRFWKK